MRRDSTWRANAARRYPWNYGGSEVDLAPASRFCDRPRAMTPPTVFSDTVSSDTVSGATERALELPGLLRLVAQRAASDLGRRRVLELCPAATETELEQRRRRWEEARRLIVAQPLVPHCERPFEPLLAALAGGGHALGGRDLVEVAALLSIASKAAERIASADPACGELAALADELPSCADLERSLRTTFDSRGEIREDAKDSKADSLGDMR